MKEKKTLKNIFNAPSVNDLPADGNGECAFGRKEPQQALTFQRRLGERRDGPHKELSPPEAEGCVRGFVACG